MKNEIFKLFEFFPKQFAIVFALFIASAFAGHGPIAQLASPSWNAWNYAHAPVAYASHYNNWDGHYDGRWDGAWDHQGNWYNNHAAPAWNSWNYAHSAPVAYVAHAYAAPHAYAAHAYAPAHIPAHSATYKAATLGATHVAPLPGHTVSRTNLNLAAPPTH